MVVQMVLFIYFNCLGTENFTVGMCVNTLSHLIPWFVLPSRKTVTTAHFTDTDQGHQKYLLFSLSPHPPLWSCTTSVLLQQATLGPCSTHMHDTMQI